ncbi:DUF6515 family protein [Microbulbifer hydrolyticus]|uniref:Uncharacterized protein n=1 Tax=Microbulbifer hydrolyticus TaxID=48074 RepID=A0A6P1T895_9GAMM|nr:DUF6515 family protein [Microbulbifer hydrolyticus]MBB5211336.1 hypothetical protein [Microbulbifer hydrolyticus]QHQ37903.1 hypothetical protein GTQ55_02100 [Microbulbifer hydrolyticus]
MKNAVKFLVFGAGLATLLSFAFAAPADAHSGHRGHHHGHGYGHGRDYWGPRYRRGPRIGIGFTVPVLPGGFINMAVGGRPYYYGGGYFYRPAPSGYVVVSAPLGASVLTLPSSAVQVQIGGFSYYQYGGAYYQWQPQVNRYVVVPAPAGVTTTTTTTVTTTGGPVASAYNPGQVLDNLPAGYTAEVVNGVQYYRYGEHYFMPTQRDGREVYVVVQI